MGYSSCWRSWWLVWDTLQVPENIELLVENSLVGCNFFFWTILSWMFIRTWSGEWVWIGLAGDLIELVALLSEYFLIYLFFFLQFSKVIFHMDNAKYHKRVEGLPRCLSALRKDELKTRLLSKGVKINKFETGRNCMSLHETIRLTKVPHRGGNRYRIWISHWMASSIPFNIEPYRRGLGYC